MIIIACDPFLHSQSVLQRLLHINFFFSLKTQKKTTTKTPTEWKLVAILDISQMDV